MSYPAYLCFPAKQRLPDWQARGRMPYFDWKISPAVMWNFRLDFALLPVFLLMVTNTREAQGQYTPWEPTTDDQGSTLQAVAATGAQGRMTMTLSCHDGDLLISVHLAQDTPFDTTTARPELPLSFRWDNEATTTHPFTQHPENARMLSLSSATSPDAAVFVDRWLAHSRMRAGLPASHLYPLPVLESWSLTGTTAEWTSMGCAIPLMPIP